MNKKRIVTIAVAGVVVLGVAVGITSIAMAGVHTEGSNTGLYPFDNDGGAFVANGATIPWGDDVLISPSNTDPLARLQCPADSTGWSSFITRVGTERTPSAWQASAPITGHNSTRTLLGVDVSPFQQVNGAIAPIKSAGGDWSFGVACLKDDNVHLASSGLWYFTAHVTAGSGDFTFDPATRPRRARLRSDRAPSSGVRSEFVVAPPSLVSGPFRLPITAVHPDLDK